jgi:flagellar hook assembly protein FlgD
MIMFDLPFPEYIHLDIYDLSGRKVRSLLDGIRTAGRNVIYWNGTSDSNTELSPGMYLLQLSYPIGQQSIRMVKY